MDFSTKDLAFIYGDRQNIVDTLPVLKPEQQEDVFFIESRFREGKGYLCTNGTGTGKTIVGLGVVQRFLLMKKQNIIIVVPSDKKCKDWVEEAFDKFGIDIHQLQDTNDEGNGICVTTYANFYQNDKLVNRIWDLIIYDESHYLTQNSSGDFTVYLRQHKKISNVWSTARGKASKFCGPIPKREDPNFEMLRDAWNQKFEEYKVRIWKKTKVLFLSATPFAYHKSLIIGDGTLWDMHEQDPAPPASMGQQYNEPDAFQKFMIEHLGYRMSSNKLTIPETGVDMDLMEREFFEKFKGKGVMSTRQLEIDKDYSRDFIKVNAPEAQRVNSGIELLNSREFSKSFPYLSQYADRHFTYAYLNVLLEVIKAKYIKERIEQHLYLDRKVVVFHSFNDATVTHPFRFDADNMTTKTEYYVNSQLQHEIKRFKETFPAYWDMDLSEMDSPLNELKKHFPEALLFNGKVPNKKRNKNIELFQDDHSGYDVLLVQSKAGREGISLHDVTGKRERVSIDLSLPTIPTEAIQKEGRIYRYGVKSNAIYEYIVLQLYFEKIAFAEKIAKRSKTVENLALGNLARDLETAFKEGYLNAHSKPPNITQGFRGKFLDRVVQDISDFDRAKVYYYARVKNRGMWKHMDYFATPEPLGLRMVEWLKMRPGEKFLEPSAGHGAIARWASAMTDNTFIEPVAELMGKLSLNAKGKLIRDDFENHYTGNKYQSIAMNPPFGTGGKLAAEHLAKAMKHGSAQGCTLFAIVPMGPAMDKRLESIMADKETRDWFLLSRVLLPSVAFKKESTSVFTQILKFVKFPPGMGFVPQPETVHDLTHITDIETFFDAIKTLNP